MLATLSIRNFVLIDNLDIDFSNGLCVLTGETGAGKSILLDALSLAIGARADASQVRAGAGSAALEFAHRCNVEAAWLRTHWGPAAAAAVLAGSTFGNTCSPIADNTVLASLSTGCDLVLHAKTMAPYTLLTGGISFFCGTLPVSLGWYGPAVGLLICLAVVTGILLLVGKDADRPDRSKILHTDTS